MNVEAREGNGGREGELRFQETWTKLGIHRKTFRPDSEAALRIG